MTETRPAWGEPLQIGSVTISGRAVFAPMAGVSDLTFRLLCKEQGAALVCMEMISAKAIVYGNRRTRELWETDPAEAPVSLQLFGHEPEVFAEACGIIEKERFDILDINMGCPVPKVTGNHEGSALMKDPALIEKIVRACVEHSSRPVTVKIRKGFDEEHLNAVECALAAQEGGASAVAVHGRTRAQMYSGQADWTCIAAVKEALRIPVIGNGDVTGAESALRMMEETGCDAVMAARAARGNPWIFREIDAALKGKPVPERPVRKEVIRMLLRHADMLCRQKGETIGMRQMRGHAASYLSGFPGAARVRGKINRVNTLEDLEQLMSKEYPYA
ncbi:MAG: tRNA dihydrouridine synthase DusB [Lachnospiraceae bacterium]|nr:tRNA dihydrouridine synthase DusB [Lachnospiraceae bacterium]